MAPSARLRSALAALACVGTLAFAPAPAAASAQEAAAFMQSYTQRAMAVIAQNDWTPAEQTAELRALLADGFALRDLSRFVLGDYAKEAAPGELAAFTDAFQTMLIKRYSPLLAQADPVRFQVGAASGLQGYSDQFMVESRVLLESGDVARVIWRIKRTDSGYRILDVMAEGSSMAVMLRDEYQAVIRTGGLPYLTDRLRALNASR